MFFLQGKTIAGLSSRFQFIGNGFVAGVPVPVVLVLVDLSDRLLCSSFYFFRQGTICRRRHSPALRGVLSFSTCTEPSVFTSSMRTVVAAETVTDFSLPKKSPSLSEATLVLGVGCPFGIHVRMLLRIILHGLRSASIRIAFAEHRIHGGPEHFRVTGAGVFFRVGGGNFGEVRKRVAVGLQLGDGLAFNCGTEALTLGSLMMLASGLSVSAPSSARLSFTRWDAGRRSEKTARMRAATEMSRVSTEMPECFV